MVSKILKFIYIYLIIPIIKLLYSFEKKKIGNNHKKILINLGQHKFLALGEVIFTNTLINLFSLRYPDASISLIVGSDNKWLDRFWRSHSNVSEFIIHPPVKLKFAYAWLKLYSRIKRKNFDLALVMIPNSHEGLNTKWFPLDPLLMYWLCHIKSILGEYTAFDQKEFLALEFAFNINGPHWIEQIKTLGKQIGLKESELLTKVKPTFRFQKNNKNEFPGTMKIAINHGGGREVNRRWPINKYKELCVRIARYYNPVIYLIGGMEEANERQEIKNHVIEKVPSARIENIINEPLNETANYIFNCLVFIGNDSGPTHLATAIGIPVIVIFGPTDSNFFGPPKGELEHIIIKSDLPCQPCQAYMHQTGTNTCRLEFNQYQCLNELSVDVVFSIVQTKLQKIIDNEIK